MLASAPQQTELVIYICVSIYVCMYMYMCVYMYMYMCELVMCICVYVYIYIYLHLPLDLPSQLPLLHHTPLGHHITSSWAPWAIQQLPTSYLFYTWYISVLVSQFIPSSPFPFYALKSILYVYIFILALQICQSVPIF